MASSRFHYDMETGRIEEMIHVLDDLNNSRIVIGSSIDAYAVYKIGLIRQILGRSQSLELLEREAKFKSDSAKTSDLKNFGIF